MSALASVAMVSGTPSCSLSSIAVAPISWTEGQRCLDTAEGHGFDILEILADKCWLSCFFLSWNFFSTYQKVFLNLLIDLVESSLSVVHDQLRIFVFPGPGCVLVSADVFVTQAQRPQGRVGKFLKYKT